jgi:hypothetical protein
MSGHSAYCMRCKAHRAVNGGRIHAHNGKHRIEGACASCGGRVSSFIASHSRLPGHSQVASGRKKKTRAKRGKGLLDQLLPLAPLFI